MTRSKKGCKGLILKYSRKGLKNEKVQKEWVGSVQQWGAKGSGLDASPSPLLLMLLLGCCLLVGRGADGEGPGGVSIIQPGLLFILRAQ